MKNNKDFKKTKLPAPVYFVSSPDDETVLVALDVTILEKKQELILLNDGEKVGAFREVGAKKEIYVEWFDTIKTRLMAAEKIELSGDEFSFTRAAREGGGVYTFRPMTLEIYNKYVKDNLIAGEDFDSEADLVKAFQETYEDSY